jgi:hypothetical protein
MNNLTKHTQVVLAFWQENDQPSYDKLHKYWSSHRYEWRKTNWEDDIRHDPWGFFNYLLTERKDLHDYILDWTSDQNSNSSNDLETYQNQIDI